jgi:hypothetical protein
MLEVGTSIANAAEIGVGDGTGVDAAGVGEADPGDEVGRCCDVETLATSIHQVLVTLAARADAAVEAGSAIE